MLQLKAFKEKLLIRISQGCFSHWALISQYLNKLEKIFFIINMCMLCVRIKWRLAGELVTVKKIVNLLQRFQHLPRFH